jgi:hypothetical protein
VLFPGASQLRDTLRRIGLWFVCLPMAVALFSLLFTLIFNRAAFTFSIAPIFRPTMMFALPVWCLYLPWVIALEDAEGRRIWTILFSGSLIGPASVVLWCYIRQIFGNDAWQADPLTGIGGVSCMIFAFIVGFFTTCLYVIALKVVHRLS